MGWEEYYDYNFPDDEKKVMGFKILENAMKWKQAAAAAALEGTNERISFLLYDLSMFFLFYDFCSVIVFLYGCDIGNNITAKAFL